MRLVTTLLLVPVALFIVLLVVLPANMSVIAGIAVALLYFVVLIVRASDWS